MESNNQAIAGYSVAQAVADGVLVEVFQNRWPELSGGKPILASRAVADTLSLAAIREIWNAYVEWWTTVMPTLPEEDQLFIGRMNDAEVWVLEDDDAFTVLYPSDY